MRNIIILLLISVMAGCETWQPKIGQVWILQYDPFQPVIYRDSIIEIKDGYILFVRNDSVIDSEPKNLFLFDKKKESK